MTVKDEGPLPIVFGLSKWPLATNAVSRSFGSALTDFDGVEDAVPNQGSGTSIDLVLVSRE